MIEYMPVQKEESSSGEYSGGDSAKKAITKEQFKSITSALINAVNQKSAHIPNRLQGSGMIILKNKNEDLKIILAPEASERTSVETMLNGLIK